MEKPQPEFIRSIGGSAVIDRNLSNKHSLDIKEKLKQNSIVVCAIFQTIAQDTVLLIIQNND